MSHRSSGCQTVNHCAQPSSGGMWKPRIPSAGVGTKLRSTLGAAERLSAINVPTLVVGAQGEPFLPEAFLRQAVVEPIKGARWAQVIEVAAGHGLFGTAVARRFPNARVTALDWPNVLAVAKENAAREGVADRHALLPGDAFAVDWGGPYDVVLLTNFLHHFDEPTNVTLAKKAFAALAPGGRCLTLEFVPDADRVSPPATAGCALPLRATTARGDAYPFAEDERMFAAAGFARSEFRPLPPTIQQAVVSFKG